MCISLTGISQEMIDKQKLNDIVTPQRWIYIEIRKALYGLKQSGALAAKKNTVDFKSF